MPQCPFDALRCQKPFGKRSVNCVGTFWQFQHNFKIGTWKKRTTQSISLWSFFFVFFFSSFIVNNALRNMLNPSLKRDSANMKIVDINLFVFGVGFTFFLLYYSIWLYTYINFFQSLLSCCDFVLVCCWSFYLSWWVVGFVLNTPHLWGVNYLMGST